MYSAAVAATTDVSLAPKEGEEKVKLHTHSYCCLDYAQVCHFFFEGFFINYIWGVLTAEGRGNQNYFSFFYDNISRLLAHRILICLFIDIVMMKFVVDL